MMNTVLALYGVNWLKVGFCDSHCRWLKWRHFLIGVVGVVPVLSFCTQTVLPHCWRRETFMELLTPLVVWLYIPIYNWIWQANRTLIESIITRLLIPTFVVSPEYEDGVFRCPQYEDGVYSLYNTCWEHWDRWGLVCFLQVDICVHPDVISVPGGSAVNTLGYWISLVIDVSNLQCGHVVWLRLLSNLSPTQ